jgi:hypothetical protein
MAEETEKKPDQEECEDPKLRAAREHFVEGVLARDEAAEPDESGKVPKDKTHVIDKKAPRGLRRDKFKYV